MTTDEMELAHLESLRDELLLLGIKSEVDTRAANPRLRVYSAFESAPDVAEFENSVVAIQLGPQMWYSWPWFELIARVTDADVAAASGNEPTTRGGVQADLSSYDS